jgi:hypothetical protein
MNATETGRDMADDVKQFTVRIPAIYRTKVGNSPPALFEVQEA